MRELHKGEDESKTLAENNWSFKVTLLVSHIRGLWGGAKRTTGKCSSMAGKSREGLAV